MQNDNNGDKIKQHFCKGVCEWGGFVRFSINPVDLIA
jgi:hypothetical protein